MTDTNRIVARVGRRVPAPTVVFATKEVRVRH
jgi:hypothetical protein